MSRAVYLALILLSGTPTGSFAQQPQQQIKDVFFYVAQGDDVVTRAVGTKTQDLGFERRVMVTGAGANVMFMGGEFAFEGNPVKGAPYSAESVSETVQTLADGNRIVQSSSSRVYRDSEGRTRRESEGQGLPTGPIFFQRVAPPDAVGGVVGGMLGARVAGRPGMFRAHVQINDPVAGVTYVLDPETRTAQKLSVETIAIQNPAIAAAVDRAKQEMVTTGRGSVTINEAGKNVVIDMRRAGERSAAAPSTESLGTQTIEGVECEGTRTVMTIPAGQIGNELPIVITSERWYSAKLQTVVLSKRHDPLSGDTTFKLTGIDQSEPPASLFQLPADYSVVSDVIKGSEADRK